MEARRDLAEQAGTMSAALDIVANRAGAALRVPGADLRRELDEIRAYAAGVLARTGGDLMPLTYCSHCGSPVQAGTCTNPECPLSHKQGR